jgi:hypothetical protein
MLYWNVIVISNYCITHYACKGPRLKKIPKNSKLRRSNRNCRNFPSFFQDFFKIERQKDGKKKRQEYRKKVRKKVRKTEKQKKEKTRRHIESQKDWKTEQGKDKKTERQKTRKTNRPERQTDQKDKQTRKKKKEKEISFSQDFSGPHNKLESFFTENKLFQTNDSKSQRQVRSKPGIWLSSVR